MPVLTLSTMLPKGSTTYVSASELQEYRLTPTLPSSRRVSENGYATKPEAASTYIRWVVITTSCVPSDGGPTE